MRRFGTVALALALAAGAPALAEDFSAGSKSDGWGLTGEAKARFAARVTDAVCALTGDCPTDCGAGLRQMVLIREADGVMVLAMKNVQPIFTGATVDLAPYCGQSVTVDGLMIGDPGQTRGARMMQVQLVEAGGREAKTNRWSKDWEEKFPDVGGEGPWFRRDPRITERTARDGYFGLGPEVDAAWIEENL